MLSWMLYCVVVSLLAGLAALALERSAQIRQRPTRWVWATCMVASLAIVFLPAKASMQIPGAIDTGRETPSKILTPPQTTAVELPRLALPTIGADQTLVSEDMSRLMNWSWGLASTASVLVILASGVQLSWRRRAWDRGHVAGTPVYISEDSGPAVVGFLRPQIVVPRWLTKLPPAKQELVIVHERSHLDAHDTRLLTVAVCLLACMPWNPMLWWQLRRLRRAIEIDCDARVLGLGYPVARYSEMLIAVGEKQSARHAIAMAGYGSKSFLEQRIHHMLREKTEYARVWALVLICLGASLAVCAAQVAPPQVDFAAKSSEVSAGRQLPQSNGQSEVRDLRSQILHMQAQAIADKLAHFMSEIQNQVGWTTQPPPTVASTEQRRFDALRLLRQTPAITELSQLDAEGRELLKVSRLAMDVVGSGTDYSSEPKFTETVARKVYYGPVYMRRGSEPYMTVGLASMRYNAGVSLVEVNLKAMWDVMQRTKVGDRGVAYVVNAEGRVIAHPDFDVGRSLQDVSSLEQVREARTTASTGAARVARNMNGQQVVAAYARVPATGWLVFVELPIEEWERR